jgi:NAD(P)-dependent dehydrogenase (short-subunit alcohol dehydrogenase family)
MAVRDVGEVPVGSLLRLDHRGAVVTGAAVGIGAAIASRLAEAGADVVVADVDEAGAKERATRLARAHGRKVIGVGCDVADERSVEELAERSVRELGGIDVWVNNAGIFPSTPVLQMGLEDWERVLEVNLTGTFLGCREAARWMTAQERHGVIVNIDSTAGFRAGGVGLAHYVSSKHAIRGLTKSLAVELGPHDIRVLAVAPTLIDTPGVEKLAATGGAAIERLLDDLSARLPAGRAGVPDDVARVVLFCASDLSLLMTGSTLCVDGGDLAL